MVQDLADFGQGGAVMEHVGGQTVTEEVSAFAGRINPRP